MTEPLLLDFSADGIRPYLPPGWSAFGKRESTDYRLTELRIESPFHCAIKRVCRDAKTRSEWGDRCVREVITEITQTHELWTALHAVTLSVDAPGMFVGPWENLTQEGGVLSSGHKGAHLRRVMRQIPRGLLTLHVAMDADGAFADVSVSTPHCHQGVLMRGSVFAKYTDSDGWWCGENPLDVSMCAARIEATARAGLAALDTLAAEIQAEFDTLRATPTGATT